MLASLAKRRLICCYVVSDLISASLAQRWWHESIAIVASITLRLPPEHLVLEIYLRSVVLLIIKEPLVALFLRLFYADLLVVDEDAVHLSDCLGRSLRLIEKNQGPVILANHVFDVPEHHEVGLELFLGGALGQPADKNLTLLFVVVLLRKFDLVVIKVLLVVSLGAWSLKPALSAHVRVHRLLRRCFLALGFLAEAFRSCEWLPVELRWCLECFLRLAASLVFGRLSI